MIKIGVLREQVDGERRVALSPDDVRRFGRRVSILVERGAGEAAGFSDPSYFRAGARILDREGVLAEAGIVTAIHPVAAPGALKAKSVLVSRGGKDLRFVRPWPRPKSPISPWSMRPPRSRPQLRCRSATPQMRAGCSAGAFPP